MSGENSVARPQAGRHLEAIGDAGSRLEPNLEKIAGMAPDLILGNKAGSEKIYDELSAIRPTV